MTIARLMQMARAGSAGGGDVWTDPDLANASYDGVSFSVAAQETAVRGIFFKPDGTKMYVIGESGDDVNEYDLSAAWDVSSASFLQIFSIAAQETSPTSIFFKPDGMKMYVLGRFGDDVNEYDLSTAWDVSTSVYLQNFSVAAQDNVPWGLFFKPDGTKMYVLGQQGDDVNEYNLSTAWNVSTASFVQNFSVATQEITPTEINFNPDGTKMFIVGTASDSIHEYDLSTAWDVSTAVYNSVSFSVAAQEINPLAFRFKSDGSKMYVLGFGTTVYQYSTAAAAPAVWTDPDLANASYDSVSFSVAGQATLPVSIFFKPDGTKLYHSGQVSRGVYEYSLSTAWDISTISYTQSFSVGTQDTAPQGLFFRGDGSKLYVLGASGDDVNEYSLSTAWDISTASFVQVFSVSAQDTSPRGVFLKEDGLKMYVTGSSSDSVHEYSLSSAWDISTALYVQSFSVSTEEAAPMALFFAPNGLSLYITGFGGVEINEYSLSTAWDISTASFIQNFSVAAQDSGPSGVFFKSDGSKMFVIGYGTDTIYQYSTA